MEEKKKPEIIMETMIEDIEFIGLDDGEMVIHIYEGSFTFIQTIEELEEIKKLESFLGAFIQETERLQKEEK